MKTMTNSNYYLDLIKRFRFVLSLKYNTMLS